MGSQSGEEDNSESMKKWNDRSRAGVREKDRLLNFLDRAQAMREKLCARDTSLELEEAFSSLMEEMLRESLEMRCLAIMIPDQSIPFIFTTLIIAATSGKVMQYLRDLIRGKKT